MRKYSVFLKGHEQIRCLNFLEISKEPKKSQGVVAVWGKASVS